MWLIRAALRWLLWIPPHAQLCTHTHTHIHTHTPTRTLVQVTKPALLFSHALLQHCCNIHKKKHQGMIQACTEAHLYPFQPRKHHVWLCAAHAHVQLQDPSMLRLCDDSQGMRNTVCKRVHQSGDTALTYQGRRDGLAFHRTVQRNGSQGFVISSGLAPPRNKRCSDGLGHSLCEVVLHRRHDPHCQARRHHARVDLQSHHIAGLLVSVQVVDCMLILRGGRNHRPVS
jgi:hypothetical protein